MEEEEKFFADAMLGKLALWMRVAGYDVSYESAIEDGALVKRALKEERVILTRDTLLAKRKAVRGRYFFVESDKVFEQLRQVISVFGIDKKKRFTRCVRCNILLEHAPKESIKEKVPSYVYLTQESFSICPSCKRIYWAGTHRQEMEKVLEAFGM